MEKRHILGSDLLLDEILRNCLNGRSLKESQVATRLQRMKG